LSAESKGERWVEKLTKQAVLLLIVHGLFAMASALSGTFVNVFLWKAQEDFALLGWFALAGQIANALTFYLTGKWVKEGNKMNSLRLGVSVSGCFYLVVLLLGKQAVNYVILLGALQGMASGFFWLAFNVVYFEVTGPEDRDRFNGWSGLIGSATGMLGPWISGLLIARASGGSSGYRFVFTCSLAVFALGVVVSFFLKKRPAGNGYDWMYGYKTLKKPGTPWKKVFTALAAQGIREGVFTFIIGVLIFVATRSESKVGSFALVTSAVSLISYWLIGRMIKPATRNVAMLAGAMLMIAAILPLLWKVNYFTLLIFGIVAGASFPLYIIPITSSVFDLIGRDNDSASHRVEHVITRELGLNTGRVIGTLAFLLVISWRDSVASMNGLLLAVGSSPLLAWWMMRSVHMHRASGTNDGDG
jgi:YQGE family putative transporter